jgi:hypothetical protein
MALALALKSVNVVGDGGRKQVKRVYDVTFTGSYANTGTTGDPIDFTSATIMSNPNKLERALFANNPEDFDVTNNPPGYLITISPGTAIGSAGSWGLRIWQTGSGNNQPFSELANGAYPAGLTGITSGVRVVFYERSK